MKQVVNDPDMALFHGESLAAVGHLESHSIHCVVTSPPYWRLRDYGEPLQLGREETSQLYVERMVDLFGEIRRVLTKDATVWLNLGDTWDEKQLQGVPWRVALALQADGWFLRGDIIWSKANPMPSSVKDRPVPAHEYVFLLSPNARYFYDRDATKEPAAWERWGTQTNEKHEGSESAVGWMGDATKSELAIKRRTVRPGVDVNGGGQGEGAISWEADSRYMRDVWHIPLQPYDGAHYAVMPEEVARRCIVAGCPKGGVVLDPFVGTGTTCLVARKNERRSIGIDVSLPHLEQAAVRLQQLSLLSTSH